MGINNKKYRNIYEQKEEIVDFETGEIKSVKKFSVKKVKPDRFMRVYLEDASGFLGINNKGEYKVLFKIWEMASYDTNEVVLLKQMKEKIANETNMSYTHVRNSIAGLTKKGILINKSRGIYILNPNLFFKGAEVERVKVIEFTLKYELIDTDEEQQDEPKK